MRESTIEKAICDAARARGISTLKLSGPNDRGKADRLFMKDGKAAFLEIKATGQKPTELQQRFLQERLEDGFRAAWTDSIRYGVIWLDDTFGS